MMTETIATAAPALTALEAATSLAWPTNYGSPEQEIVDDMAFAAPLTYDRKSDYRTPDLALPFNILRGL